MSGAAWAPTQQADLGALATVFSPLQQPEVTLGSLRFALQPTIPFPETARLTSKAFL